ncbi:MAG: PKD domain-containing protein, partial [Bacteroidota bacterium]
MKTLLTRAPFDYSVILLLSLATLLPLSGFGQNCNAGFSTNVEACNLVTFTPQPNVDPTYSYTWNFGDGSFSSAPIPTHTYVSFGTGTMTYTVTLTVNGPNCTSASTSQQVQVSQIPDARIIDASGNDFVSCSLPQLTIENASTTINTNTNYNITFEGSTNPNFSAPSFSTTSAFYTGPGSYPIFVEVTGNNGCINVDTFFFIFSAQPNIGGTLESIVQVCLPGDVSFSIAGIDNNTPNTQYIVESNNGMASFTLTHPPAATVTVPLDSSSCGTTSIINGNEFADAFQISVTAETGCPNQDASVALGPIRTATVPVADFEILPDDEACPGDLIDFENTSKSGLFFDASVNGCVDRMGALWSITPSTGFDIVSGSLQDSAGFSAEFNIPDSYTVELIVANNVTMNASNYDPFCGADTIAKTLCILPNPASSFNSNYNNQSCFPTVVEPTNTSNTINSCGASMYTWQVNLLDSECGNSAGYSFINGTSAGSQDPSIQFDSSGLYELVLIVVNECGRDTSRQEIEIASSPFTQITPIPDSCFYDPVTIQPSLAISAGCYATPTYLWTFPGGNPSSFSGTNPPPITYNTDGTYTVFVETTNDCGVSTTSQSFTLFEPPSVPDITHTTEVCVGQSINFNNPNPGNLNYSWTGPNSFSSSSPSPTIPNATGIDEGNYVLVVTDDNGCTDTQTYPVSVGANASLTVSPNPDTICIGQTSTLTASGAMNYLWSPPDFLSSTNTATVMVTPDAVDSYTYTVTGNDNIDCNGAATVTVVVVDEPTVDAGLPQTTCINTDLQLNGSPLPSGSASANWTGTHVNASGLFNSPDTGRFVLTYQYNAFGCGDSDQVSICVTENPEANFSTDQSFGCESLIVNTTNLTNVLNSCASPSYAWSVQFNGAQCHDGMGMWSYDSGNGTSVAPSFLFSQEGSYTIQLSVTNFCSTSTTSQTVVVAAPPQVDLASIDDGCDAFAIVPSFSASTCNALDSTYTFSAPGGNPESFVGLPAPEITYSTPGDYTIYLELSTDCGTAIDSTSFSILEGPMINVTLDTTEGCPGNSIGVNNNSTGDALVYNWTTEGPHPVLIDLPNGEAPTFTFPEPGNYTIHLSVSNSVCAAISWSQSVEIFPAPTINLGSFSDFCGTASIVPTATFNVPDDQIEAISWTFSGGEPALSTAINPGTVNYDTPGNYSFSVEITTRCGMVSATESFSILEAPAINVMADTTLICRNQSINISNTSSGDSLSFLWTSTGPGQVIISNDMAAEPTLTFPDTGTYTLNLEIANPVCEELIWMETIRVFDFPMFELVGVDDFCGTASFVPMIDPSSLNIPETQIDSIRWSFDGGQPATSTSLNPGTVNYTSPGNYSFSVSLYTRCGMAQDEVSFSVLQAPAIDVMTNSDLVCLGDSISISNNSTGDNLSYNWLASDPSVIINDPSLAAPIISFTDTGSFILTLAIGNPVCEQLFWRDTIQVYAIPTVEVNPIDDFCDNAVINPSALINLGLNQVDSIRWLFSGGQPATSTTLSPGSIVYNTTGNYTVTMMIYNPCGADTSSQSFAILAPIEVNTALDDDFSCTLPFSVNVNNATLGDSLAFEWSVEGPHPNQVNFLPNNMVASPSISFQDTGIYVVIQTISNPVCDSIIWRDTVRIFAPPALNLTPVDDFCQSVALSPMIDYGDSRIDSVHWDFPGGIPAQSNLLFPNNIQYEGAEEYIYSLTAFNICGMTTIQDTFIIDTIPPIILGPTDTICIDDGPFQVPEPSPVGGI